MAGARTHMARASLPVRLRLQLWSAAAAVLATRAGAACNLDGHWTYTPECGHDYEWSVGADGALACFEQQPENGSWKRAKGWVVRTWRPPQDSSSEDTRGIFWVCGPRDAEPQREPKPGVACSG